MGVVIMRMTTSTSDTSIRGVMFTSWIPSGTRLPRVYRRTSAPYAARVDGRDAFRCVDSMRSVRAWFSATVSRVPIWRTKWL